MKTRISLIFLISILIFGCEQIEPDIKTADTPVVEAYIFPGKDSVSISIKKMIGYLGIDQDTVQQAVTDGIVQIVHNGDLIEAIHDDNNPGNYFASLINLELNPGDTVSLQGSYQDISFSSYTIIPGPPEDLDISDDRLYYDRDNPRSMITAGDISISWTNNTNDFYYVFIENIEEALVPLNEMLEDQPPVAFAPPSKSDEFRINMRNIRYFGDHRVIVYHVNPEFADLFDQSELTSNSIVEPPGNIENALGIFTALTADTVYFTVSGI